MSNFSFCHNVFNFIQQLFFHLQRVSIFQTNCFQIRLLQMCFMWERVNIDWRGNIVDNWQYDLYHCSQCFEVSFAAFTLKVVCNYDIQVASNKPNVCDCIMPHYYQIFKMNAQFISFPRIDAFSRLYSRRILKLLIMSILMIILFPQSF